MKTMSFQAEMLKKALAVAVTYADLLHGRSKIRLRAGIRA
jgi:hypothetical protein